MQLTMYQVDAFTSTLFGGNPAAVLPLSEWLDDDIMQNIAAENNLSETAFFVKVDAGYQLRWFTPVSEVDLCGHATLASAWVLYNRLYADSNPLRFQTRSGELTVSRSDDGLAMDFPAKPPVDCEPPRKLLQAFATQPETVMQAEDYILIYAREEQVLAQQPDLELLKQIPLRGVVITAPGIEADFVSRMFGPKLGIAEDPVTGSSHCSLTPYWAEQLGKVKLVARQLSRRGGEIRCELDHDRVKLSGHCVEYLCATINV